MNLIFMNHLQDVARGHFIARRLEREYGMEMIKNEYQKLADQEELENREFSPVEGF